MSRRHKPKDPAPSDQPTLQEFIDELRRGDVVIDGAVSRGQFLVTSYAGEPLPQPVPVRVTPGQFAEMLANRAADPLEGWDPDNPRRSAFMVELENFHETFNSVSYEPLELVYRGGMTLDVKRRVRARGAGN